MLLVYFMLVGSFINSTKIYSIIRRDQAGPRLHNLEGRWEVNRSLQFSVGRARVEFTDTVLWETRKL